MKASISHFYKLFFCTLLISYAGAHAAGKHAAMFNPGKVNQMRDERRLQETWVQNGKENKEQKQKKSSWLGNWFGRKTLRDMTYEEVKVGKDALLKKKNYYVGLKYLERMLALCDNLNEREALLLEYADTLFYYGKHQKAGTMYHEFASLYPGSEHAEYSLYRAVLCSAQEVLEPDRDQTATHATITLADTFLARADIFKEYAPKVEKIRERCYKNLAASELNVCVYFKNSGKYKQAQRRLDALRTNWTQKLPVIEPQILAFEKDLAELQNDTQTLKLKLEELEKFPNYATLIAENTPRKNFLNRF
jgi:outer membrane protein assembly factor BamD (BamD/ComL family)